MTFSYDILVNRPFNRNEAQLGYNSFSLYFYCY